MQRYRLLLLPFLVLFTAVGCGKKAEQPPPAPLLVSTLPLTAPQFFQSREFNGRVIPAELTTLSFRIDGEIRQILVKPGQRVEQGELLAKLDNAKLREQLKDAQSRSVLASRQLNRARGLVADKLVSQSEFDELKANARLAKVKLDLVKAHLSYTELRAPFAGVIADVPKEAFEIVAAGEHVLDIYQADKVYVHLNIPNNVLARLDPREYRRTYQPEAHFAGSSKIYRLNMLEYTTEPNPESQAVEAWLTMAQPEPPIPPGTEVTVKVDLEQIGAMGQSGFRIPMTAVDPMHKEGEFAIWKASGGQAKRVGVDVVQVTADGVLVTGNVERGEHIIISNLAQLRDGVAIRTKSMEQ